MNHLSTASAKSFANIYFDDKDAEVDELVAAAEDFVAKFLNYDSLSHEDLLVSGDSPPADSPGAEALKPGVLHLVKMAFNEYWQNREINIVGTISTENPAWMRAAHLYRRNLGV